VKFALLGHPVAHSLSPVIHRAAYRVLGQAHDYELIDVPSDAELLRVVASLRGGKLQGVNVTVPWKREAYAAADRHSALAERLGVANVLSRDGDRIVAHNTDALALEAEFKELARTARVVVLGSGGATPAVVAAAVAAGIAEVYVSARRFDPQLPDGAWPGAAELPAGREAVGMACRQRRGALRLRRGVPAGRVGRAMHQRGHAGQRLGRARGGARAVGAAARRCFGL
jgi:hypothetical protein